MLPTNAVSRQLSATTPALMSSWLQHWNFTRLVTLTFNQPGDGMHHAIDGTAAFMRDRLYHFDARMNRRLIGRDWQRRPDNRMFHFFAPEKIQANPHWHGLVCFYRAAGEELSRQHAIFDRHAKTIWGELAPKGTLDVKPVDDLLGGIDYVAKSLQTRVNWDHCIFPDQFWATRL